MRFKGTWMLLILFIILLGAFFLIEQPRHKKKTEEEEHSKKLTELKKTDIRHVTIESPDKKRMQFDKKGNEWIITDPVHDRADDATLNTLVISIADAQIERTISSIDSLAKFGLDQQASVVTLSTAKGDTALKLYVGIHNLTKSHFYARVDTARDVLLLPATIRRYVVKELPDFRNKKVIDFKIEEVRKLTLASTKGSITWERDPADAWFTVQEGDTIKGDKYGIEAMLRSLKGLRVKEFVSDNSEDFSKFTEKKPRIASLWTGSDLSKKSIKFGRKEDKQCYIKRDSNNRIVKVEADILEIFDKTVLDLRNRKLLAFDRNDLSKISLQTPDTTATIVKVGNDWSFPNPAMGTIEQYKVSSFLYKLENLKFNKVIKEHIKARKPYGMEKPSFKVSLYDKSDSLIDEVICGNSSGRGKRFATSRSSPLLAEIPEKSLDEIFKSLKDIRKVE